MMKRFRGLLRPTAIAFLLAAVVSGPAAGQTALTDAQNVYPIDLTTALRLAGSNSLKIAEAEAQLREASGDKLSAYERFLPSLSAEWVLVRHEGRTQATAGQFLDVDKQYNRPGGRFSAAWDLNESLFAVLAARRRHQSAEHLRDNTTDSVLLDVANSYLSLALAAANVRIAQNATAYSVDFVKQTESSTREGVGFKVDVLRARTQLAHDRLGLQQAEEDVLTASARLAALLNLDEPITLIPLDSTMAPLALVDTTEQVTEWLAQAVQFHPFALAQRSELAALRAEKTQAIWGPLLPEIEGQALFTSFGPVWSDLRRSRDYRVSVRWSIGPGGLFDFGRIRSRSARQEIAEARFESTNDAVAENIVRSHARLRTRGAMLSIARDGLEAADETLTLARGRRELGVGLALEVITAADALTRAQTDYARAISDYNRAQVEALTSLGRIRSSE